MFEFLKRIFHSCNMAIVARPYANEKGQILILQCPSCKRRERALFNADNRCIDIRPIQEGEYESR